MRDRPEFDSTRPEAVDLTPEEQVAVEEAMRRYWLAQEAEVVELRPRE